MWTFLTALVAGVDLDELIPDHTHWPEYGPDYTLPMDATLVKDTNKSAYVEECIEKINGKIYYALLTTFLYFIVKNYNYYNSTFYFYLQLI